MLAITALKRFEKLRQKLPKYTYATSLMFFRIPNVSDYVSFIKKALLLTQRFPLIQRIDIVLVPQLGFDEQDSGYVNGDAMSPTHEDWLKTTDEERAARLRAQVVKQKTLLNC